MNNFEKHIKDFDLFNIGYIDNIPKNHINYLKNNIDFSKKANEGLAGYIREEYFYDNWSEDFERFIIDSSTNHKNIKEHLKTFSMLSKNVPYYLNALWANKQKKYEFNPIHNHTGALSFIVFLKIPYDLKEEDKVFPKNNAIPSTSRLTFFGNRLLGGIYHLAINVDKSFENKMLVFPASLYHLVYPFYTSDDYRITVSGNISFYVG